MVSMQMNKKKAIAVAVAVAFIGYIFFSDSILNIFNFNMDNQESTQSVSGFKAQDTVVGSGTSAEAGDSITAHYTGRLANGTVFDSSVAHGGPITFVLGVGQVIRGWDEGIIGMKEGGKRILTISSEYAYGPRQVGSIPPNSTLIFEVELLKVAK